MQTREFWLSKAYSDFKRYPYGFSRSGDFTINQSRLIEQNGHFIIALLNDQVSDATADDLALKKAILEGRADYSDLAAAWMKYRTTHHTKISVSSSAKSTPQVNEDELAIDLEDWDDE